VRPSSVNVGQRSPTTRTNETNNDCHTTAAYITVVYFMRSLPHERRMSPNIECALKSPVPLVLGWVRFAGSSFCTLFVFISHPVQFSLAIPQGRNNEFRATTHNTECLLTAGSRPWKRTHSCRAAREHC